MLHSDICQARYLTWMFLSRHLLCIRKVAFKATGLEPAQRRKMKPEQKVDLPFPKTDRLVYIARVE